MEDDVLLPGEDPGNSQKGDAEHWISVYQELLDHNRRRINHMRNHDDAEMETQPWNTISNGLRLGSQSGKGCPDSWSPPS